MFRMFHRYSTVHLIRYGDYHLEGCLDDYLPQPRCQCRVPVIYKSSETWFLPLYSLSLFYKPLTPRAENEQSSPTTSDTRRRHAHSSTFCASSASGVPVWPG